VNPALRAALEADLASRAFAAPPDMSLTPRRVGAEVELIPLDGATGRRCPLEPSATGATPTLPFLRRYGSHQGWREVTTAKGTPSFQLPAGGTLTFEPGGQVEYSSPACRSPSVLLTLLRAVVPPTKGSTSSPPASTHATRPKRRRSSCTQPATPGWRSISPGSGPRARG